MKILILAVHFEVTGARYIADAFKRLNHDVRHVGPEAHLKDAWGIDVPSKYEWKPDFVNEIEWYPDLIIIADTQTTTNDIPYEWTNDATDTDIPVIKWVQDNHVRNVREDGIAHYFLAHAHGPAQPVVENDETWLPCAADLTAFQPSAIPWDLRPYDVCMIGVMYPQRVALINQIREAGYTVFAETGLVYDEYAAAYQNSRISLVSSACGDLPQRFFETAAMGCLVLTDVLSDLADDVTNKQLGLSGYAVYQKGDILERLEDWLHMQPDVAQAGAKTLQSIVRTGQYTNPIGKVVKPSAWGNHSWDARAQVIISWFEANYGGGMKMVEAVNQHVDVMAHSQEEAEAIVKAALDPIMEHFGSTKTGVKRIENPDTGKAGLPFLNLGCGKTHFPSAPPMGHELVDASLYTYPLWLNVDKVEGVGADKTFDLFTYPWPLEDNSFDGAMLAHILEHIPHEIKVGAVNPNSFDRERFEELQDGWYAFMSELYRVLTPNAIVHIISPYGHSDGGITDPSHTRYLTINTFTHSMTPEISDGSTFKYNNGGINFQVEGSPKYRVSPLYSFLMPTENDPPDIQAIKSAKLERKLQTNINVIYDFYIKLKVVK